MAFISIGEAVDRVLARLADQREEKAGSEVLSFAAGKVARADRADYPARGEEVGCKRETGAFALRQRGYGPRDTGRPMADLE